MNLGSRDPQGKIRGHHLERLAYVYVRQSSLQQVHSHQESRRMQYQMHDWASEAGWPKERIIVVDEDQGKSSASPNARSGFARLVAAVAREEVGIVVGLEVSRLARNSPDWHHLVYLCRWTDTLIADESAIYDPSSSADRMVLGIRGQVSEIELDHSIGRMVDARWNKARRGELLTILPAGYEVDDYDQIVMTSDEGVIQAIRTIFDKFDELGSARQVSLWWQEQGLKVPVRRPLLRSHPVVWVEPVYRTFLRTLRNPIYAGIYAFGRTQTVRELDPENPRKLRTRKTNREEWPVLIEDHHAAYIAVDKFLRNQERLTSNLAMKRAPGKPSAVREGEALLQGLVLCGHCGRSMYVNYGGGRPSSRTRTLQYRCNIVRRIGDKDCQILGGKRIEQVVVEEFLKATEPASIETAKEVNQLLSRKNGELEQYWKLQIERAEYEAQRAERQFHRVEPENRLVARELERRWNECLRELEVVKTSSKEAQVEMRALSDAELERVQKLSRDLERVWSADTTTNRDRKRLLRSLIEEVQIRTDERIYRVRILWKGSAITDREVPRRAVGAGQATSEDTVELVRKLAHEFDDAQIARILNKQGRRTGRGNQFTTQRILSLRSNNRIPKCAPSEPRDLHGGPFTADEAAEELGVSSSTLHAWLREGIVPGTQVTPGAPWRIVLTEELRTRLKVGDAPPGWVGLTNASRLLGVSKQLVAYLVKTGKLNAVRTKVGNRQAWRIEVPASSYDEQPGLFDQITNDEPKGA